MNNTQNDPISSDCVTQAHIALNAAEQAKRKHLIARLIARRQSRAAEVSQRARQWESRIQLHKEDKKSLSSKEETSK